MIVKKLCKINIKFLFLDGFFNLKSKLTHSDTFLPFLHPHKRRGLSLTALTSVAVGSVRDPQERVETIEESRF